jgi:hypothetical protein
MHEAELEDRLDPEPEVVEYGTQRAEVGYERWLGRIAP